MNEEKILGFLNISKHAKHDKFLDKIFMGFNVGFTLFIGGSLWLSSLSKMNEIIAIAFVIVDFLIALVIVLNKNPAISYIIDAISLFLIIAKLLTGYAIFSNYDAVENGIPQFTWIHLAIILMSFWFSVYLCRILYRNYKIIEKNPLPKAKKKIEANYRVPKWLPIAALISSCPMVFVRLLKDRLSNFGIGIGFILLSLACVLASAMFVPCLFKCIVIIRFKAYKFFR